MVTRYDTDDRGVIRKYADGELVLHEDYKKLSAPAIEWFTARSEFLALTAGDPRSAQFLNRLSEAEDGLRVAISKAKGEQE